MFINTFELIIFLMEKSSNISAFSSEEKYNSFDEIDDFFDEFMQTKPLFRDKNVLCDSYNPKNILHREIYLKEIAKVLAPLLRGQKTSNLFIYGKVGTGKTLCVNHILSKIENIVNQKELGVQVIKINCKLKRVADTEFRILLEMLKELGFERENNPSRHGESTNKLYTELQKALEKNSKRIILVLDEIDSLIKKIGDEFLYNLIRINPELKNSKIGIVGITNDMLIMDNIDTRVKSSLSEEEIIFLPYNAVQIEDILYDRSKEAFETQVIEEGVIQQAAAFAAKEHGDARRALELLRYSGEIAERENSKTIKLEHLVKADKKSERNKILDIIKSQPKQFQMITYSIIKTSQREKLNLLTNKKTIEIEPTTTGEVYDYYNKLAKELRQSNLSLRRISDIIVELEVLGLINFKIVSKGRYGRTRFITLGLPKSMFDDIIKLLKKDLELI